MSEQTARLGGKLARAATTTDFGKIESKRGHGMRDNTRPNEPERPSCPCKPGDEFQLRCLDCGHRWQESVRRCREELWASECPACGAGFISIGVLPERFYSDAD